MTALFRILLRRLWNGRWVLAGRLAGLTAAVALAAAVPAYSSGAVQRVFEKEMDLSLSRRPYNTPLGAELVYAPLAGNASNASVMAADERVRRAVRGGLGLRHAPEVHRTSLWLSRWSWPAGSSRDDFEAGRNLSIGFMEGIQERATIIDGRWPVARTDGQMEAVIEEKMLSKIRFDGEAVWTVGGVGDPPQNYTVRIVGVFRRNADRAGLWAEHDRDLIDRLFVPEDVYFRVTAERGEVLDKFFWYLPVDYNSVRVEELPRLKESLGNLEDELRRSLGKAEFWSDPRAIFDRYEQIAASLRRLLVVPALPILALAAYYVLAATGRAVASQRGEIAVLRSRGATATQLLLLFAFEGMVMAAFATLLGAPLGTWLARAMGSAQGFLHFVIGRSVPAEMSVQVWVYAAVASLLVLPASLVPVAVALRDSVVVQRQRVSRRDAIPGWARHGFDLLLAGAAFYGWWTLKQGGGKAAGVAWDPLHLLVPALLIFAGALALMRLLPLLARALSYLSGNRAPVWVHMALVRISRAFEAQRPVAVLLVLTVGLGLFSASVARTLDQNLYHSFYRIYGTDAVVREEWQELGPASDGSELPPAEPPFGVHAGLPGVRAAARVFTDRVDLYVANNRVGDTTIQAIDTQEFSAVAWHGGPYLPYRLVEYLTLMAQATDACLVSDSIIGPARLKPGDRVRFQRHSVDVNCTIYAAVPIWPGITAQRFVVVNLDELQWHWGVRPYDVWLRMEPGAPLAPALEELRTMRIYPVRLTDARVDLQALNRSPALGGLYGFLTFGFLAGALVSALGYYYLIMAELRDRAVEVGTLRAIGMGLGQLAGGLALEQALVAGSAAAAGTGLGWVASRLFTPLLGQEGWWPQEIGSPLPLLVASSPDDHLRMYAIFLFLLVTGAVAGVWWLRLTRLHEALKLGEDA